MKAIKVTVSLYDIKEHAHEFMSRIGASYVLALPQSVTDSWQFFGVDYNPDSLPSFVRINNSFDPKSRVGCGLSQADADKILKWMAENNVAIKIIEEAK